jgi:hypothetical protein
MGVFDEAIREHLELKRRHGADPGEVAQLERRALGPAEEPLGWEPDEPDRASRDDLQDGSTYAEAEESAAASPYSAHRDSGRAVASERVQEETVEIEMSELFASSEDVRDAAGSAEPGFASPPPPAVAPREQGLDFEDGTDPRSARMREPDGPRRSAGRFPSRR